jgi:phosphoserine phosphatase|tara:strand:+ start:3941 stop:4444 length:504 start_codon:yes stop_codon:yes gene_type:complete
MRKIEKAFVFDFDDTLAFTDAKIKVDFSSRFTTGSYSLTPAEFNTHTLREGESFDFSDFDKASFILNGTPTKLIDLARDVFSEGHSVFILTARADQASSAIVEFLAIHGVVASEVHCVGSSKGGDIAKAKRKVLLSIIENFDRVWFFDDDDRNIALASELNCKAKKV